MNPHLRVCAADAGPLADMGPYYLASLTYLLGHIEEVIGAVAATRPKRTIATGPRAGQAFTARAPTHVIAMLRTETGIPVLLTTSFDAAGTCAPHLEIHGSTATMVLPDPNFHAGDVLLGLAGNRRWKPLQPARPVSHRSAAGWASSNWLPGSAAPAATLRAPDSKQLTSPRSSTPSTAPLQRQDRLPQQVPLMTCARQSSSGQATAYPVADLPAATARDEPSLADRTFRSGSRRPAGGTRGPLKAHGRYIGRSAPRYRTDRLRAALRARSPTVDDGRLLPQGRVAREVIMPGRGPLLPVGSATRRYRHPAFRS
jgi:hypothetical protein